MCVCGCTRRLNATPVSPGLELHAFALLGLGQNMLRFVAFKGRLLKFVMLSGADKAPSDYSISLLCLWQWGFGLFVVV